MQTLIQQNAEYIGADDIAREHFFNYLNEKLSDAWEDSRWEFYTFLLEQAKKHGINNCGYRSFAFQRDAEEAKTRNRKHMSSEK